MACDSVVQFSRTTEASPSLLLCRGLACFWSPILDLFCRSGGWCGFTLICSASLPPFERSSFARLTNIITTYRLPHSSILPISSCPSPPPSFISLEPTSVELFVPGDPPPDKLSRCRLDITIALIDGGLVVCPCCRRSPFPLFFHSSALRCSVPAAARR